MPVLSRMPRERHGFDHRFANDNGRGWVSPPARDVALGERWAFIEHRTMAEVAATERWP